VTPDRLVFIIGVHERRRHEEDRPAVGGHGLLGGSGSEWGRLGAIPWPRGAWVLIARSGLFPWGLLAMPTVVLLVAAVVAAVRHQDPLRWVSMAIGAAVGALALVAIVVAALGVIAWIAS
jgi:hypothetical protein